MVPPWSTGQCSKTNCLNVNPCFLVGSLFNCTTGVTYFDNLLFIDTVHFLFINSLMKDIFYWNTTPEFQAHQQKKKKKSRRNGGKMA